MKKLIIVSMITLVSFVSYGQIQVYNVNTTPKTSIGKIKSGLAFVAEMEREVEGKDTTYTLYYQEGQYQHITSIKSLHFNSVGNSFDSFYEICKSVFKDENKKNKDYMVTFKLGDKDIAVVNSRMMGVTCVRVMIGNSYTNPLVENQIDKLFGRN
jgi:hypothetical protein